MKTLQITRAQARRFLLHKHGLLGEHRFHGKQGVLDFVRQAGCVQFDPVDVCGKSAEIALQSRVEGFTKQHLHDLLYVNRALVDCFDKNLSIMPMEDWPYFERYREHARRQYRSRAEIDGARDGVKQAIAERGPLCSADFDMPDRVTWAWSNTTKLSRATLEHLYHTGELAVHHKKGTIKYYDLAENCIPVHALERPEPYPDDHEHRKWRVVRRIGSVGLLWDRSSPAWQGIGGLSPGERALILSELVDEGGIAQVEVEGLRDRFYTPSGDREALDACREARAPTSRCEFLAPLDNTLWDRKLVLALFDFDYRWEIYTPVAKRRYGHYVLPLLYGEGLVGRIEFGCDRRRRVLSVTNLWYEDGIVPDAALLQALTDRIQRFAAWNDCDSVASLADVGLG